MDASRKATREGNETNQSRQDVLLTEELNEERLRQLLEFVGRLKETPAAVAEVQRRVKLFGDWTCIEGENVGPVLCAAAALVGPGPTANEIASSCSAAAPGHLFPGVVTAFAADLRCHILETKGESYRLQEAKRQRRTG